MHTITFFKEVHLGGLVLRDPVTAITNVFIFLAGLWCWRRLRGREEAYVRSWRLFFLFLGIPGLIGVIVHGFSYYTSEQAHLWIWLGMGIIQNLGISFAQIGTVQHYFPKQRTWLIALVLLQFVLLSYFFVHLAMYKAAKWHVAIGLLPVMGWSFYQWAKGNRAARWIALGIAVSGITVAVHSFKISISEQWFNYNDIAHFLIVASLLLMVRAFLPEKNSAETPSV